MLKYVAQRTAAMVPILLIISFLLFVILALAPGDPLDQIFQDAPDLTAVEIEALRLRYRLDDPIPVRYFSWLKRVTVEGNLGMSRLYARKVSTVVVARLPATLTLTVTALVVALGIGVPIGIYSALRQYSVGDYVVTIVAFVGRSMPSFWFAISMILVFGVWLKWLPITGMASTNLTGPIPVILVDRVRHAILPVTVLGFLQVTSWVRYVRASLLEILNEDYLRTARAKGLPERVVIYKHAMRNAAIPLITILALNLPHLVGGSVVIESVFSWPGIGSLLYDSILSKDYNLAMTCMLLLATLTLLASLLADLAYAWVDPRVVSGGGQNS